MQDKYIEKAHAKINLFLKIINKRNDGFHNIRSVATLINLHDEIVAEKSTKFEINYTGRFAPSNNTFDDCIIEKLFTKYNIIKPKYNFIIKKNVPVQSGLGSASSNVAAIIRILTKLNLIKDNNYYNLGSDVPLFIKNQDCLIRGKGDYLKKIILPKYYFLLIKPNFNCSTKEIYNEINLKNLNFDQENDIDEIHENDIGNDFESIVIEKNKDLKDILIFLRNLNGVIFSRLTGTGSCVFAAFEDKNIAMESLQITKRIHPNLWSCIAENNINYKNK